VNAGTLQKLPLKDYVAATSVGVVDGGLLLDLNYDEDSRAQVDMNLVQTGAGQLVEVQGTAEGNPFSREVLYQLLALASQGVRQLVEIQKTVVRL
jgi:ribonuclease PH